MGHCGHSRKKSKATLRYLIALATIAAIVGCGQESASPVPPPAPPPARKADAPARTNGPVAPAPGAAGAAASVLRFAQGSWLSDCETRPLEPPFKVALKFSGLSISEEITVFDGPSCTTTLASWSRELTVASLHRFEPIGDSGVTGIDLNVTAAAVRMTTFNGYGAISSRLCGLASWTDGVSRDVSGRDCGLGRHETTGQASFFYLEHHPESDALSAEGGLMLKRQ